MTDSPKAASVELETRSGHKSFETWWLTLDPGSGKFFIEHRWNHDVFNFEDEEERWPMQVAESRIPPTIWHKAIAQKKSLESEE